MSRSSAKGSFKDKWLVEIRFLDHCQTTGGISSPIECRVWGLLVHEDKDAYYLAHWVSDNEIDENTDSHTILKKVVSKVIRLSRIRIGVGPYGKGV